jgi:hypothetical protein
MIIGVVGIYLSFLFFGIYYEKISINLYLNSDTNQLEPFRFSSGFLFSERTIIWLLG